MNDKTIETTLTWFDPFFKKPDPNKPILMRTLIRKNHDWIIEEGKWTGRRFILRYGMGHHKFPVSHWAYLPSLEE